MLTVVSGPTCGRSSSWPTREKNMCQTDCSAKLLIIFFSFTREIKMGKNFFHVQFMSYSKWSNWRRISKGKTWRIGFMLTVVSGPIFGRSSSWPTREKNMCQTDCSAKLLIIFFSFTREIKMGKNFFHEWFMSYSKCSNWRWISKLSSNFACLFVFCYWDGTNSIKTDLHICNLCCNLWICKFVSYKSAIYFLINLPKQNSKK